MRPKRSRLPGRAHFDWSGNIACSPPAVRALPAATWKNYRIEMHSLIILAYSRRSSSSLRSYTRVITRETRPSGTQFPGFPKTIPCSTKIEKSLHRLCVSTRRALWFTAGNDWTWLIGGANAISRDHFRIIFLLINTFRLDDFKKMYHSVFVLISSL